MSAARIAAAAGAAGFVCLAGYRLRTGRRGRAALGLLVAALLALLATGQVAALPDGDDAVGEMGDALGAWTYPFVGAMAFLETSIPPLTLLIPGEWAVLLGGAMAGEGRIHIAPLVGLVWACSAAGDSVGFALGRRLGRPFVLERGARFGLGPERLARIDGWLDRYGSAGVCLSRLVPLARPLAPFLTGASRFSYRRFLAWDLLGTLLFSLLFCGLGYAFYSSYDRVAATLSTSGLVLLALGAAAAATYVLIRRRRRAGAAAASEAAP